MLKCNLQPCASLWIIDCNKLLVCWNINWKPPLIYVHIISELYLDLYRSKFSAKFIPRNMWFSKHLDLFYLFGTTDIFHNDTNEIANYLMSVTRKPYLSLTSASWLWAFRWMISCLVQNSGYKSECMTAKVNEVASRVGCHLYFDKWMHRSLLSSITP